MNQLKNSLEYKEAISATSQDWPESGVGITEKETVQNLSSLSRQLNSILFTVIKLRQEVAELKRSKDPVPDLSPLIEQLNRTHLSPQGESFAKRRGTIKVYRKPSDLLKEISK